jgi:RNA polymerase sigma factor (sigma-70 family)
MEAERARVKGVPPPRTLSPSLDARDLEGNLDTVGAFPTISALQPRRTRLAFEVMGASEDNTATLLLRWRGGSREAGDRLLHRYVPELAGFFGRRSGSHADELVQRTLLACTQSVGQFEGRSTFRTYLYGIARNQYLMYRRAEAFARHTPVTLATLPEDGPSQLVAVRQEQVMLILALRRVEPDFSLVLRKYYWEEHSVEEIAQELEIPVGTVKSRLARGRASLRAHLESASDRDDVRDAALRELTSWLASRED